MIIIPAKSIFTIHSRVAGGRSARVDWYLAVDDIDLSNVSTMYSVHNVIVPTNHAIHLPDYIVDHMAIDYRVYEQYRFDHSRAIRVEKVVG